MKNILPKHVAFIMDGNRRWAKKRGLPTFTGHAKGYQNIEKIVDYSKELGIKNVTFWAFSTENWNREKAEVNYLMDLLYKLLKGNAVKRLIRKGGKLNVLGDINPLSDKIKKSLNEVIEQSKNNSDITINIGLNYGGRPEIINAVNRIIKEKIPKIDEEKFSSYLYTSGQPDPDMVIRTAGEQRLSGFLPWQAVYSELYFTETFWPDFSEKEFDKALAEYARRERRFGK